jgi:hypothetical protein
MNERSFLFYPDKEICQEAERTNPLPKINIPNSAQSSFEENREYPG